MRVTTLSNRENGFYHYYAKYLVSNVFSFQIEIGLLMGSIEKVAGAGTSPAHTTSPVRTEPLRLVFLAGQTLGDLLNQGSHLNIAGD